MWITWDADVLMVETVQPLGRGVLGLQNNFKILLAYVIVEYQFWVFTKRTKNRASKVYLCTCAHKSIIQNS